MVYGSAAVMPSGSEITEAEAGNISTTLSDRTAPGLLSVQSDPAVLSRPSSLNHRRHNSMLSLFSSDSLQSKLKSGGASDGAPSNTTTPTSMRNSTTPSSRMKWDWKIGDFWHSRSRKSLEEASSLKTKNDLNPADVVAVVSIESNSSVDSIANKSVGDASFVKTKNDLNPADVVPIESNSSVDSIADKSVGDASFVKTKIDLNPADVVAVVSIESNSSLDSIADRSVGDASLVKTKNDLNHVDASIESNSDSSIADISVVAARSPSPPSNDHLVTRNESQASLHYISLGIFASSKYSSSDLDVSGSSSSSSSTQSGGSVDVVQGEGRVPLARRWREIQGEHGWENLLEPLDRDLRAEILRYGDLAQMAYDNFQDQSWSKYAGSARFNKKNVFEKLHKEKMGYQVTRYLYATCENPLPGILQSSISAEKWDVESNWMGFVAVAVDEQEIIRLGRRDIVVSWRGTSRPMEWLVDAQIQLAPMTVAPTADCANNKPPVLKPKVEKGFWSLYTCKRSTSQFNQKSASEQVMRELARLLTLYKGETLSITLTGHSLGGALAVLTAYEIAETGLNSQTPNTIPVTVFSFGSPRIGDAIFKRRFEALNLKALRIINIHDMVPKAIGGLQPPWSEPYKHVGVELQLNSKLSPYLKPGRDPIVCHNLECYLHHVDGYQGSKAKEFRSETGRDHALVNKHCDGLKREFCVPRYWWQEENKGLVMNDKGRWVEPDRALEDVPSMENQDNFI